MRFPTYPSCRRTVRAASHSQVTAHTISRAICTVLLVLLSATGSQAAAEDGFPGSFTARYHLQQHGLSLAVMDWNVKLDPSRSYHISIQSEMQGIAALLHDVTLQESSRGVLENGRFLPREYHYRQSDKPAHDVSLHFDPPARRVSATYKGEVRELELDRAGHDKLSYILQMMLDLGQDSTPLRYTVVEKQRVRDYPLKFVATEMLETELGQLEVVRLHRGGKTSVTFWCAPRYSFLPVRIQTRKEEGKASELQLLKTSIPPRHP